MSTRAFRALVVKDALLDDVLGMHREALGRDLPGYRGHVYRAFNFAWALAGYPENGKTLALAAAFHDIGIWADGTFDYLAPSARRALAYASERQKSVDAAELERMVLLHHKLTRCRGDQNLHVEAFRRADLVDLTWGLVRFGLPNGLIRDAHAAFPNSGFHCCLLRVGLGWALRHPTRPLPIWRW